MKDEITIVQLNEKIPVSFSVVHFDKIFPYTHSVIQLVNILDGECDITVDEDVYHAKKDDILIINAFSVRAFSSQFSATMLVVNINQHGFELDEEEVHQLTFHLNSVTAPQNRRYESIRYLIYSMIKFNTMDNINSLYTNRAIAFSLFAQLMNDFRVDQQGNGPSFSSLNVNLKILNYIHEHYKERLTLSFLANHFNYNISYLSRLFKSSQNKTFNEYYDQLRINNSMNDLLFTNKTIAEIASDNGFENARSYVRAFSRMYNAYPSDYRKAFKAKEIQNSPVDISYLRKDALDRIIEYYDAYNAEHGDNKEFTRETESIVEAEYDAKTPPLNNPIRRFLNIGNVYQLLSDEIKSDLEETVQNATFTYAIVTSLFDHQSKSVVETGSFGRTNLFLIEKSFEYLLHLGLKPFIRFTFFSSYPKEPFLKALKELLLRLIGRFSQEEVMTWRFSLSPEKDIAWMNSADYAQFMVLLSDFWDFIKSFSGKLAAPTIAKSFSYSAKEITVLRDLFFHKSIPFDFFCIDCGIFKNSRDLVKNKNELKDFIAYLKRLGIYNNRILFENVCFAPGRNLLNDTLYASNFISKNFIDNYPNLYGITFFPLSDLSHGISSLENPYQGGDGIFTFNSIKKASCNALILLSRLGGDVIKSSKNYLITKEENHLRILINNYCHYSDLYAEEEYYAISENDRYSCFPKSTNCTYIFKIHHILFTAARIKISEISTRSGSSFDKRQQSGGTEIFSEEEYRILKQISEMQFTITRKKIVSNSLIFDVHIAPLETKLIEITLFDE